MLDEKTGMPYYVLRSSVSDQALEKLNGLVINPGLLLAVDGPDLERFLGAAATALSDVPAATMLTPGIHGSYAASVAALAAHADVRVEARGQHGSGCQCQPALFSTTAEAFQRDPALREEVFGAAALLVRCGAGASVYQF